MQGAHDAVDVDTPNRRDATAGDRLAVGHDGEGLQGGLAQARGGAADDELLDELGVLGHGGEAPPSGCPSQEEAVGTAVRCLSPVLGGEVLQQRLGRSLLNAEGICDRGGGHRFVGDDENRLGGAAQLGLGGLAHANSSSSSIRSSEAIMPVGSS